MANYDPLDLPPGPHNRPVVETEGLTSAGHDIFFAAVATTRMPMIITDPRLRDNPIVFANPAFTTMTGFSEDELLGHNCRLLQGADTDRATIAAIRRAIKDEREIATEILNYRKDGGSFWNALFISPVRDPSGKLIYFFASQLDVSRRRDAEDALRQAQKMEALGQLTGGIAHDFNNLLQVIVGHLDVIKLQQSPDVAPQQVKSLLAIRQAASKARTLTQQLLAFARKQQLEGRVLNLNAMATHLMELAERTLGSGIDLRLRPAPQLWNCRIDPTQAEMALLNILLNARDAMPGGGTVTIATDNVSVEPGQLDAHGVPAPGRYVSLTVTDTGQGMPQDILARVMDPFFTTKDKGEGTGLGLSMVYGFAKQSGGSVTLYSEVGVGTTVRLYFPVSSELPRQVEPKVAALGRPGTEHVLVVDDRIEVAEMTELMLSSLGYRTGVCTGAAAALDALQTHGPFDLLLTDLIMPGGMNGVMLARRARELQPGIKVLIATGFADASLERSGVSEGEFEVVYKPYGQTELARKVRQVLEGPTGVG